MTVIKDAAAREKVKTLLDKSILLEAGAGSGKTSAMADRFLELLSNNYADLSEIVAITYTKKAANELAERIRRKLTETDNPLARQLHKSFIGTIHSFCGKLLRERPIEAGVDPQFTELDEAEDYKIRDTVWEEFVMNADKTRNDILELMELFDLGTESLKQFLKLVCDNPDLEFELPGEGTPDLDEFLIEIDRVYMRLVSLIKSTVRMIPDLEKVTEGRRDALQLTVELSLPKIRRKQPLSYIEKIRLLKWFHTTSRIKVTQKCWGDDRESKKMGKEIGQEFADFKLDFVAPLFEIRGRYGYNNVAVPFVKEARSIYEERKKTLSVLNFQDLLLKSTELLEKNPKVREYFQNKYKYILVDEFQDTDPVQAKLLMYLTGEDTKETDWEKIKPIPGSLFVVGDPKQSIFSFRRADISIYRRFKDRMRETEGEIVEFTTNFRSVNDLGNWYNPLFKWLFGRGRVEQAEYGSADTVKDGGGNTVSGTYKYKVDQKTASLGGDRDIDHIERIIKFLVEKGTINSDKIEYKDIMILFLKKQELTKYGKALARRGIPVKTTGADVISRSLQFQALSDIIRALAYPEENALLYKVLRGPVFRYTDDELFKFSVLGGGFNIYQDVRVLMEGNEGNYELLERIRLTFELMKRFASYMRVMVPAAAAERMVNELGMMAAMLSSKESMTEISSFVSLIEKIRMNKLTDVWDLNQFVEEMNLMIEAGYEEEVDLEGENQNAVRMMNLHKAKGLEAPIVILAAPYKGAMIAPNFYVDRSKTLGDKDYGIARIKVGTNPYSKEYICPAAWGAVEGIANDRAEDERDRLLYVAATRAENALIISDGAVKDSPWRILLKNIQEEDDSEEYGEQGGEKNSAEYSVGGSENEDADADADGISDIDRMIVDSGYEIEAFPGEVGEGKETADHTVFLENMERTNRVLTRQQNSYELIVPSGLMPKGTISTEEDAASAEFDGDLILQNTMELFITGDKEEFRRIRTKLGTAVHMVLEGLIKGERDQDQLISFVSQRLGETAITERLLKDVYRQFSRSKLYERIRKSKEVYTEVPVSLKVAEGESFGGVVCERDCYINGSMDLLFLEEEGWTIVDYKTCDHNQVKHELMAIYKPQLDAYKEAFEKATGAKVAGTEVFFIEKVV